MKHTNHGVIQYKRCVSIPPKASRPVPNRHYLITTDYYSTLTHRRPPVPTPISMPSYNASYNKCYLRKVAKKPMRITESCTELTVPTRFSERVPHP